ncbi:hypothetical protein T261_5817 [Streptomyces lydicus]|nr:hypothetical protein T261_5817 [Streptomyces lydicus]
MEIHRRNVAPVPDHYDSRGEEDMLIPEQELISLVADLMAYARHNDISWSDAVTRAQQDDAHAHTCPHCSADTDDDERDHHCPQLIEVAEDTAFA